MLTRLHSLWLFLRPIINAFLFVWPLLFIARVGFFKADVDLKDVVSLLAIMAGMTWIDAFNRMDGSKRTCQCCCNAASPSSNPEIAAENQNE